MTNFSKQYWVFPPKICMNFSHYVCDMAYPSNPPWLDHSYNIWRGVQVMKLLIAQFYPIYCYFFCYIQICSSAPCSWTPTLYVHPSLCGTMFHTCSEQQAKGLTSCTFTRPT
jgi:hypothetical protein